VLKNDIMSIRVDDQTVEPPEMFKDHLPQTYVDDAPRLVHNADGSGTWQFRDIVIPNVALNAVARRPKRDTGWNPQGLDEIRPGCYTKACFGGGGLYRNVCGVSEWTAEGT
jgi:hypothetical protein